MKTLRLGQATVELYDWGLTVTRFGNAEARAVATDHPEARPVPTQAQVTAYRERALRLGYGSDTARMSREHEVLHSLSAQWLGLPYSHTLHGVATGQQWPYWHLEEAFVLAGQTYCRALGIDIVELAERWR